MTKSLKTVFFLSSLFLFTYCGGGDTTTETEGDTLDTEETTNEGVEEKKYTLTKVSSPEFADASLSITNLENEATIPEGAYTFNFEVNNYELGVQTEDAEGKALANSDKGQHIHVIMDNEPYSAHYEPKAEKELEAGGHIMLAFLSRSYHESVKNDNSYILRTFTVGEGEPMVVDLAAPHLFYSRPKGEYTMAEGDGLLLDFFLINTTLSPDGNQVRATINGEEHMITEWAPYSIGGLEMGEVTIKLELVDAEGNVIDGPFNTVERTVTLTAADA